MFETYQPPPPPVLDESDSFKPSEYVDRPLVLKVLERKEGIITTNSPNGAPGVVAHVLDLTTGLKYRRALFMSGNAVDGLTPYVGKGLLVIRLVWKEPRREGGRKFIGIDPAGPADLQLAQQYAASMGDPFVGPDFAPAVATVGQPAAVPAWQQQAPVAPVQPVAAPASAPAAPPWQAPAAAPVPAAQPVAQQPAAASPPPWEQQAAAPVAAPAPAATRPPWETQG